MNTRSGKLPFASSSNTSRKTDLKKNNKLLRKNKTKISTSYSSNTPKVDQETTSEQKLLKIEEISILFESPNLSPTEENSSVEEEPVLKNKVEIVVDQQPPVNMADPNNRFNEPMWN